MQPEIVELELDQFNSLVGSGFEMDILKDIIKEAVMETSCDVHSYATSFAYLAVTRFIYHCKKNNLKADDVLFDDIKKFIDELMEKSIIK